MSKTKRNTPQRTFEVRPLERHIPKRRCDECGEWFPADELNQDFNEAGKSTGFYCEGCIQWR